MLTVNVKDFGAESITEGTVMEWKVSVGGAVKKGDVIAAIETDKVTVDVTAEADGVLAEILVPVDETAVKDAPLYVLNLDGTASAAAAPAEAPAAPASPASAPAASGELITMKTPDFGAESITEGTLMEWKANVGDFVKKGSIIALVETDKVTVEAIAEADGILKEIFVKVDETANAGADLCTIMPGAAPAGASDAPAATKAPAAAPAPAPAAPAAAPSPAAVQAAADGRGERREKMKRMRMAIARNLKASQNTLAQLTTFQEVDMSGAMAFRKEYKELFEEQHGSRLTFNSIFFKACAHALEQIPSVNAYIDEGTSEVVYRDYVDISFAASNSRGLITPVLRNVEGMSILEVEKAFSELAKKAKADKLSLDETMGATFTVSNGGVFGSMLGTPLIGSTTQSAVLGLHAIKNRAKVLKNGEIAARPIMYVALTYDHRLVDGREAVTFLTTMRDMVEDPRRLLLRC
jgi:2-oxoglutarate dehydrogenase E2 component (dihydrolipoamide succinyltransferase)